MLGPGQEACIMVLEVPPQELLVVPQLDWLRLGNSIMGLTRPIEQQPHFVFVDTQKSFYLISYRLI